MKRRLRPPIKFGPDFAHEFMMSITIKKVNIKDYDRNQNVLLAALPTAECRKIRIMDAWPGARHMVIVGFFRSPQTSQKRPDRTPGESAALSRKGW